MFIIVDDFGDRVGIAGVDVEQVIRAAQNQAQMINSRLQINKIDADGLCVRNVATVWPSGIVDLSLYGSTIA